LACPTFAIGLPVTRPAVRGKPIRRVSRSRSEVRRGLAHAAPAAGLFAGWVVEGSALGRPRVPSECRFAGKAALFTGGGAPISAAALPVEQVERLDLAARSASLHPCSIPSKARRYRPTRLPTALDEESAATARAERQLWRGWDALAFLGSKRQVAGYVWPAPPSVAVVICARQGR